MYCMAALRSVADSGRNGEATNAINPWEYLPHTALGMDREGLEFFLAYLAIFHGIAASGDALLEDDFGAEHLIISDGHVVS